MADPIGAYQRSQQTTPAPEPSHSLKQPQKSGKFGSAPEDTVAISAEAKAAALAGTEATNSARAS
jgi:hypothetical protein